LTKEDIGSILYKLSREKQKRRAKAQSRDSGKHTEKRIVINAQTLKIPVLPRGEAERIQRKEVPKKNSRTEKKNAKRKASRAS